MYLIHKGGQQKAIATACLTFEILANTARILQLVFGGVNFDPYGVGYLPIIVFTVHIPLTLCSVVLLLDVWITVLNRVKNLQGRPQQKKMQPGLKVAIFFFVLF